MWPQRFLTRRQTTHLIVTLAGINTDSTPAQTACWTCAFVWSASWYQTIKLPQNSAVSTHVLNRNPSKHQTQDAAGFCTSRSRCELSNGSFESPNAPCDASIVLWGSIINESPSHWSAWHASLCQSSLSKSLADRWLFDVQSFPHGSTEAASHRWNVCTSQIFVNISRVCAQKRHSDWVLYPVDN